MPSGGKECNAARVETHDPSRKNGRSCVLKACHVRVPVDADRRLASVIGLARPGRIIHVARWSAIGWQSTSASRQRLRLQYDCSCIRRGRASGHFKDYGIDTRRCSRCVEGDGLRLSAREIRSNKVAGRVFDKGVVIICRRRPRLVYEDLILGRVVAQSGGANAEVDRQRIYAARVWHRTVWLAKNQVAGIGITPN